MTQKTEIVNKQRQKTPGQVVNEFEEVLDIKKERNKEKMRIGGEKGGKNKGSRNSANPSNGNGGDSWDEAAEEFDVHRDTLRQGTKVKQIAEEGEYEHRGEPVEVDEEVQEVAEKAKREKGIFDY